MLYMLAILSVVPLAILQPLRSIPAQRGSVMMSAVQTDADSETADDSDWSAVDAWLLASGEAVKEEGLKNHRWHATSKGHMHEHFVERNVKMRQWSALGASERLETNLERLGFKVPSTIQAAAFGHVVRGENLLLADANGMGKTFVSWPRSFNQSTRLPALPTPLANPDRLPKHATQARVRRADCAEVVGVGGAKGQDTTG